MAHELIGNTVTDHHTARGHHVHPIGRGLFVCRCGHAWQYRWPAPASEPLRRGDDPQSRSSSTTTGCATLPRVTTSRSTISMRLSATAAAATTIAAAILLAAGCAQHTASQASRSSTSPTTAVGQDYTNLLIKDTDLDTPGGPPFTAAPPTPDPSRMPGVAATFTNADAGGPDTITDTIAVWPNAQAAVNALLTATPALGQTVTGAPTPVAVGAGGVMQSGSSPDGSKSVTVLLFTQGPALVTLEFDRPPADPSHPDYVIAIGHKQDDAIKTGLHR